jgi:bacterioferritin-associated ferredoxin
MYICICKSVTDKQIRRAAARGVDNLYELRQKLGVASGCGTCADAAREILAETTAERAAPTLYSPSPI